MPEPASPGHLASPVAASCWRLAPPTAFASCDRSLVAHSMQLTLGCVGIIGVYAPIVNCERTMTTSSPPIENCNCLALRQAARHVTQFYDQQLAPLGLRTTQFSILAKLSRLGGLTVQELAKELVMDRTTLGRNIQPLERDRLISVTPGKTDRRRKEINITNIGIERLNAARGAWAH